MIRNFFKDAGYLFVIELLVRFKALIALPLLTQYLGSDAYGAWSQVAVVVATMIVLAVLGTDSAAMRYFPELKGEEKAKKFSAWIFLLSVMGFIGACFLLLLNSWVERIFFAKNPNAFLWTLFAAAGLILSMLLHGLRNWFRLSNCARGWGLATGLQATLSLVAILMAIKWDRGVVGVLLYSLIADFISVICLSVWINKKQGWAIPDFSVLPALIRFGFPFIPTGFAMWGLNYMDRVILIKYGTLADIGKYSVAYAIGCMLVQMIMSPIWGMYAPIATTVHKDGLKGGVQKLFNQGAGGTFMIVLPVIVVLSIMGDVIIGLVAGSEFQAASGVMWLIALGYFFSMMASYCEVSLTLVFRQHYLIFGMALAFFVNLILNLLLIPKYSIFGAAMATLVAFVAQFLFVAITAYKLRLLKISLRFVFRVLLVNLLMALVMGLTHQYLKDFGYLGFATTLVSSMLVYLILIKVLRVVPLELERQILFSLRAKIGY